MKAQPISTGENRVRSQAIREALHRWFQENGRDLPWRRTHDPYAILVSEYMLQQTTVAAVAPRFVRWLQRFPTFAALATASEQEVLSEWQGLGYYARARNLRRAALEVAASHGGVLPGDPEAIGRLPGVGPYIAGAVASFAFDLPAIALDANINRVLARLFNVRTAIDTAAGADQIRAAAAALLPETGGRLHTSALMELGALVCLPRAPRCHVCPVRGDCQAEDPASLPLKRARPEIIPLAEHCGWDCRADGVLLEQQAGRWGGLWKLPAIAEPEHEAHLLQLTYPFTHHRVTLRVYPRALDPATARRRFSLAELEEAPMPSPHRRAVQRLLEARDA